MCADSAACSSARALASAAVSSGGSGVSSDPGTGAPPMPSWFIFRGTDAPWYSSGIACPCSSTPASGWWTSMNSPCGSRLMMPVSMPCSSVARSERCRPRQIR